MHKNDPTQHLTRHSIGNSVQYQKQYYRKEGTSQRYSVLQTNQTTIKQTTQNTIQKEEKNISGTNIR